MEIKRLVYIALLFLIISVNAHAQGYTFIENKGQWADQVFAKAEIEGGYIYFEKDEITYDFYDHEEFERYVDAHHHKESKKPFDRLKCHSYKVQLLGGNLQNFKKDDQTEVYYNYFLGDEPSNWGSKAYGYKKATYSNVYKGINLVYYTSNDGKLKYDFMFL